MNFKGRPAWKSQSCVTFLNYCSILFPVLDNRALALLTACLECSRKANFPIHHEPRITHLHSPPLATSPPLLRHKLLLFAFTALHNLSLFYRTSSEQRNRAASHLQPAQAACFCSLHRASSRPASRSAEPAVSSGCRGSTASASPRPPPAPSAAAGTRALQPSDSLFPLAESCLGTG